MVNFEKCWLRSEYNLFPMTQPWAFLEQHVYPKTPEKTSQLTPLTNFSSIWFRVRFDEYTERLREKGIKPMRTGAVIWRQKTWTMKKKRNDSFMVTGPNRSIYGGTTSKIAQTITVLSLLQLLTLYTAYIKPSATTVENSSGQNNNRMKHPNYLGGIH